MEPSEVLRLALAFACGSCAGAVVVFYWATVEVRRVKRRVDATIELILRGDT